MRHAVLNGWNLPTSERQVQLKWGKSRMQQHHDALAETQEMETGQAAQESSSDTGSGTGA